MNVERVADVEAYLDGCLVPADPALTIALETNGEAGLPAIDVSPSLGKLLYLLAKIHGATRILEVGTLGGYSTIWLARALPEGGRLTTLELEPKHATIARKNVDRAEVGGKVEILVGPAIESLSTLEEPYDLAFIDADKPNNPTYWRRRYDLSGRAG